MRYKNEKGKNSQWKNRKYKKNQMEFQNLNTIPEKKYLMGIKVACI